MSNKPNWIDEFLQLLISETDDSYSIALDLKNMHLPQKLYRYRSLEKNTIQYRYSEIVDGELFLPHSNKLNDPFEICSILESHNPQNYMSFMMKEKYMQLYQDHFDVSTFNRIFNENNTNWYEDLMEYVTSEAALPNTQQDLKDTLSKAIMYGFEKITETLNEFQRNIIRFACFSETATNLPMWYHYTNQHKGICLEYDTQNISNVLQLNRLFPVKYVDKLPDATSMLLQGKYSPYTLHYMAMHKLMDWAYEHEWRLILDVGAWYRSPKDIPADYWEKGQSIQFIKPSRIIMGTNISAEHEQKMFEYADIAKIPVAKAKTTEYGLQFD